MVYRGVWQPRFASRESPARRDWLTFPLGYAGTPKCLEVPRKRDLARCFDTHIAKGRRPASGDNAMHIRFGILPTIMLAALLLAAASAHAANTICAGSLTGNIAGNVVVPPGAGCTLYQARITGN